MSKTKNSNKRVLYFRRMYALWLHVMRGAKRYEIAKIIGVTDRTVGNYFRWIIKNSNQATLLLAYIFYYNQNLMSEFNMACGREKEYYEMSFRKLIDGKTKRSKKLLRTYQNPMGGSPKYL